MTNFDAGCYYGLEAIAQRIWQILAQPVAASEICCVLLGEYDVEQSTCERDILDFLIQLEAEGLIDQTE